MAPFTTHAPASATCWVCLRPRLHVSRPRCAVRARARARPTAGAQLAGLGFSFDAGSGDVVLSDQVSPARARARSIRMRPRVGPARRRTAYVEHRLPFQHRVDAKSWSTH